MEELTEPLSKKSPADAGPVTIFPYRSAQCPDQALPNNHEKRIHVLLFESESRSAVQELLQIVSKKFPSNINILIYEVEDTLFRMVLTSLQEAASLSSEGNNRVGRYGLTAFARGSRNI